MPDRKDQAALQKFFFDEIQKGEELLAAGWHADFDEIKYKILLMF